jgi:hypothetical protein
LKKEGSKETGINKVPRKKEASTSSFPEVKLTIKLNSKPSSYKTPTLRVRQGLEAQAKGPTLLSLLHINIHT